MAKISAKKIGQVTHYYSRLGVGIVKLSNQLKVGDVVRFVGRKTDLEQPVAQLQYDHKDITVGKKGQEIGVKVNDQVREGDDLLVLPA